MTAMTTTKQLTLKLLIDNNSKKVLFAEGGKDVVDFLFSLLAIPVGTIIKLLRQNEHGMVGCIGNLYKSVETLDETYVDSAEYKKRLLNPATAFTSSKNALFLTDQPSSTRKKHYRCSNCSSGYYTETLGDSCPNCKWSMSRGMTFVEPSLEAAQRGSSAGLVKAVVTYIIKDDLSVIPMSTISIILLLSQPNVKDLSSFEERLVNLGMQEGLELLKASLQLKTALTDVFVGVKSES